MASTLRSAKSLMAQPAARIKITPSVISRIFKSEYLWMQSTTPTWWAKNQFCTNRLIKTAEIIIGLQTLSPCGVLHCFHADSLESMLTNKLFKRWQKCFLHNKFAAMPSISNFVVSSPLPDESHVFRKLDWFFEIKPANRLITNMLKQTGFFADLELENTFSFYPCLFFTTI